MPQLWLDTSRNGMPPPGPVATTTHFGPYQFLHIAHQAIHQWCQDNGHMRAGPRWEIYGHWQDDWNNDPARICTEVVYLLVSPGKPTAE
jgi:hypothetical protein